MKISDISDTGYIRFISALKPSDLSIRKDYIRHAVSLISTQQYNGLKIAFVLIGNLYFYRVTLGIR